MQENDATALGCELLKGTTLLQGQYEITRPLGVGGFGITYLARDSLTRQVVVKECFPNDLCERRGRIICAKQDNLQSAYQKTVWEFVGEARRLAKLKHPNIVAVHQVFEENHTAYIAMDHVVGEELLEILETTPERLTPALLKKTLREALEALQYLHRMGILHRDISPDNLMLGADDHLTLIDFGAARENSQPPNAMTASLLAVKDGYSPHEFYVENTAQFESSDLYSLGATFYSLITGAAPLDCWSRYQAVCNGQPDPYEPLATGGRPFDISFLAAIDRALSVKSENRIQSAAEWLDLLGPYENQVEAPSRRRVRTVARGQIQSKPCEVMLGDNLESAISELVTSVNSGAENPTRLVPVATSNPTLEPDKEKDFGQVISKSAKPLKTPVDLYGNVIENVDTWMQEQEQEQEQQFQETDDAALDVDNDHDDTADEQPKSLIMRMLTGASAKKRNKTSIAQN